MVNPLMAEPALASVPDQATVNCGEVSMAGTGATVLVRPVPASMVLKISGVLSGGCASKVTVAWALMTVPVGSDGLARMV